jgi:hypothetical protein
MSRAAGSFLRTLGVFGTFAFVAAAAYVPLYLFGETGLLVAAPVAGFLMVWRLIYLDMRP